MLVSFLALLQVTVAFQHGAHHHAHPARSTRDAAVESHMNEIEGELMKRQSKGYTVITGVCSSGTASNGQCNGGRSAAPRLEIRQLAQNADQWNLYLLGMERFMAKDKNDRLSYYQVSGVHGRPFQTWNNFPTPLLNQAGFCPHAAALFGSWHRPYLAVYEVCISAPLFFDAETNNSTASLVPECTGGYRYLPLQPTAALEERCVYAPHALLGLGSRWRRQHCSHPGS